MPLTSLNYHTWPIKHKLSAIIILISGLLIGCMAFAVTVEKNLSFRAKLLKNSTVLAEIIGTNSAAALLFHDGATAYEILSALKAEQDLIAACLYHADGKEFTSYFNPDFYKTNDVPTLPKQVDLTPSASGSIFTQQYVDVVQPIALNDKTIGYIVLRTDLTSLKTQLLLFVALIFGLSVMLFFLGALICSRLNRTIVEPVTLLADVIKKVMLTRNLDLRVEKKHDDEIGVLIDGFNSMLAQLQKSDMEIAQHQNHLETLVETRTSELKFAHEQLIHEILEREEAQAKLSHAQKMEAIGTLAGGVAHDLNNILSGIVSYPDLLLLDMPRDSQLRKPIETIRASGKRAAAIVQDLLTLARRAVKVAEPVELYLLISEYLDSPECSELKKNHPGVEIILPRYQQSFITTGSPLHLSKTVMNLVSNAAEAIPDKGTIDIQLQEMFFDSPPVDFSQWRKGPYIRLTITDTGMGISEKHLGRIFEPFYSRKVMGRSGTGLGMAVVWGTVEDHKGYITVVSEEGTGTTFQLYFPASGESLPQYAIEQLTESQYHGNGESVLVVDDSKEQRQIACDILSYLGYLPTAVSSGEAAVEYLRQGTADLLLLDMLMAPGIDGLETLQQILTFKPDQKAIIASGFSQATHVEEACNLGVTEYVLKPYTVMRIGQAVHKTLQANRAPKS